MTARAIIGSFFLWTSEIHVGVAAIDPSSYRHLADAAVMAWVERGWNEVFVANPRGCGLAVAAGELMLGLLLLCCGWAAKVGWLGVIGFHLAVGALRLGFLDLVGTGPCGDGGADPARLATAKRKGTREDGGPEDPRPHLEVVRQLIHHLAQGSPAASIMLWPPDAGSFMDPEESRTRASRPGSSPQPQPQPPALLRWRGGRLWA